MARMWQIRAFFFFFFFRSIIAALMPVLWPITYALLWHKSGTKNQPHNFNPLNCNSVQASIAFFSWSIFTGINIITSSQRSGHEIHLINTSHQITSFLSRCWCKHTSLTCYKYCWASWIISKLTDESCFWKQKRGENGKAPPRDEHERSVL